MFNGLQLIIIIFLNDKFNMRQDKSCKDTMTEVSLNNVTVKGRSNAINGFSYVP